MKNLFAGVSLNTIFTFFVLFIALNSGFLMAADVCDVDGNNSIDIDDINLIFEAKNRPLITPFDPMDIDRNGVINTDDARQCVCALPTTADCEAPLNQPPVANPGSDQTLTQNTVNAITLDGSSSSDPDGDILTFLWSFLQRPQGSQSLLNNADTVSPSFIPDQNGVYLLSLTVTDGFGASNSKVVTITTGTPISALQAVADNNSVQAAEVVSGNIISNDNPGVGNTIISSTSQNDQPITLGSLFTTAAAGSFLLQADGSYTYTAPSGLQNAIVEVFSYTINDTTGASSDSMLTINVDAVSPPPPPPNQSPVAQNDTAEAIANGPAVTGNVLSNDVPGDQPTLVTPVSITSTPNAGSFNLLADGNFTYTPPTNVNAVVQEEFPYTITDSDGETSNAILTIRVEPQVILLQAQPDVDLATAASAAVTGNLLANDQLGDLPVNLVQTPTNQITPNGGSFSLQADGSYTYIPPQSLTATVSEVLDYSITNTDGEQSSSTLTIIVNPQNTIVANPDTGVATTGGSAVTGNLLDNDELGNQSIQVTPVLSDSTTNLSGVFSLQADGRYSYTPPQSLIGTQEEIIDYTITAEGGATSQSTLTITVSPVPVQPVAQPDVDNATARGPAISGNVLTNDNLGTQPTLLSGAVSNQQTPQGGVFSLLANGTYTYMPPTDIAGVVNERFEYTITDSANLTSSSTLTITISPEIDLPQAFPDTISVTAGGAAVTDNVLNNDELGNEPTMVTPINVATTDNSGTFSLLENGSYSYLPPATVSGVVTEQYTYTITDSNAETSSSTLTVTINPPILIPVCSPDEQTTTAGDSAITGDVLINDELGNQPTQVSAVVIASTQNGGAFNLQANGNYTYTPAATVTGIVTDIFPYTITDSDGETCESTLTIRINQPNLIPLARPDVDIAEASGDAVTGDVLENDDKGDEPTLVTLNNKPRRTVSRYIEFTRQWYIQLYATKTVAGVATDQFSYTITDSGGETSSSTLTITVNPANLMPFARPDELIVTAGSAAQPGDVSTNDVLGNPPSTITLVNDGSNITPIGELNLLEDGTFTYTPPATVGGVITDVFTYLITDIDGETSSSTLTVTVNPIPVPQPPVANAGPDQSQDRFCSGRVGWQSIK